MSVQQGLGKFGAVLSFFDNLTVMGIRVSLFLFNLGLALIVFGVVCSRYLIPGSPMVWIEEMSVLLALWLYFIGAAHCTRNGSHIGGGFIDIWLTGRKLRIVKAIAIVIDFIIVVIFEILSIKYFIYLLGSNKSSLYLRMNKSVWEASMVVGFGLMAIFLIYHFYVAINDILKKG